MVHDIGEWLEGLGLGKYAEAFVENGVDLRALPHLNEDDLKEMDVLLGHRRILLATIASLQDQERVQQGDESAFEPLSRGEAERRQLSVMFCDLVGSTELSRRLDPEDLREVMRHYQDAVAGSVTRYEGYVAKFLGDGVLAYFGWPRAHEDQAERAVRAGLDAVAAVARLKLDYNVVLKARVGIATGQVVVGDLIGEATKETEAVTGETPNLAARLQGLAKPDQVVIGSTTRLLIGETFDLKDLGPHDLKGFAQPVTTWHVLGEGTVESRFGAAHPGALTQLVGREHELGLLRRAWEQSRAGIGQVVLVSGEPGIGKSRLVEALSGELNAEDCTRITLGCSPYRTNSALYPVIVHLEHVLNWQDEDNAEVKLAKLEKALQGFSLVPAEVIPLFASLLSLPLEEDRYPLLNLPPQQQKQQTLDAIVAWLLEEAERHPVLQVWEDLHWADPSTLELLALEIEQAPTAPIHNVLTFRPEFVPPWPQRSHMTPLTLNRLERPEVEALITQQADGKALPREVVEHIVGKTDGVPLYVEELTKTILEAGFLRERDGGFELIGPLSDVTIPATLQDSLMARLDRLPTIREVAQLAAVLGREFTYEMLQAIASLEEATLQEGLNQLVNAELLYQRGRPPHAKYIFKHALVQDAAYLSLLKSTRQYYHQQVAVLLESRFPDTVEVHPELVAHHFMEAGFLNQAVGHWQRAAELAIKRSANLEAIAHCTMGLDCIKASPESSELARQELALQITIGVPLVATKGYGSPEAAAHYHRARELCKQTGETHQLLPVIYGQWLDSAARGDYRTARAFGEELLHFAAQQDESGPTVVGHRTIAWIDLFRAELNLSLTHVDQGLSLYDAEQHLLVAYQYAHDSKVALLGCRACLEWLTGYPERAAETGRESIAHARHLNHPNSLAYALCYGGAAPATFRREPAAVAEAADELIDLSEKQAFPLRHTTGTVFQGWSMAHAGRAEEGIALMQKALAELARAGQDYARTLYVALLVEAALANGMDQEASRALDEAFALAERTGERWWAAELHRLRGQCLIKATDQTLEAESCYRNALRIARDQGARSLELRTAISLARLWRDDNKRRNARNLLAPVYDWFTEGFDTPDLKDAKALLDELS
ncbi:MAG: AAA family ATPase [Hyphomicrobiales bacterium]|nr:AAA family ATPase [Hyphomicrobiales bacterium]